MTQRTVYRMAKAGSMNRLQQVDEERSSPGKDQVEVEVKAIGLNFADIFAIQGLYSATPTGSFIPGLEFAGKVVAKGEQVDSVAEGQDVMGVTRFGGYVSHLTIDAHYVTPLPAGWSYQEGAAFPVQVLTAYYALFPLGNLQNGNTVLIHSGAGGVGIQANRIAKRFNAYTIGTVSSQKKADFLLDEEGYDKAIVRSGDFPHDLQNVLNGRDLDLVLESIGGKVFKQSFDALAPMGRIITFGAASFTPHGKRPNYLKLIWQYLRRPKIDPMKLPSINKSVMGFNLIWLYDNVTLMHQMLSEVDELALPAPHIGHTFAFDDLPEALQLFQQGKTVGKVVVDV